MPTPPDRPMHLDRNDTAVLLVDVQERLFRVMEPDAREIGLRRMEVLLRGARTLDVPILVTEQYPEGVGRTVEALREAAPDVTPLRKMTFSCCGEESLARAIDDLGRRRIVVAGMETHVCVFQTVLDLVERGYAVHVMADACLSRREVHRANGLALCERAGAVVSNTETALFQLLGRAGTDTFRAVSRLLR
ncbi:MAG: isochorismatase family protein [Myxococcota bacterium]